jgi:hypothetical protein
VVIQHQAQPAIRAQDESLRRQSAELARQQAENELLAALVQGGGSRVNSLGDLVSLRREVESLRKQTNSLGARDAQEPNVSRSILQMREEETGRNIARMNYALRWLRAFWLFADKNGNQFPTSFDQARPFMSEEAVTETNLTAEQFEILYRGPATNIPSPSQVIVLREKQPRRYYDGNWGRAYGFADGHSEIHSSADGVDDAWEKRHIIMPPPDQ